MCDKPVTVAVATYAGKALAEQDFDTIHGVKHAARSITSPSLSSRRRPTAR